MAKQITLKEPEVMMVRLLRSEDGLTWQVAAQYRLLTDDPRIRVGDEVVFDVSAEDISFVEKLLTLAAQHIATSEQAKEDAYTPKEAEPIQGG